MCFTFRTREAVDSINKYSHNFYLQTFCRMPPYVIGILLGWLLHRTKDKAMNIQLNKVCLMLILLILIKSTWIILKYFRNLHYFFCSILWPSVGPCPLCLHLSPFLDWGSSTIEIPFTSPCPILAQWFVLVMAHFIVPYSHCPSRGSFLPALANTEV